MATRAQRWQTLCDSLLNATASVAQQTRLANACLSVRNMDPAGMTNGQKIDIGIETFRDFGLGLMRRSEGDAAALSAQASVAAQVGADFAEAP